MSLHAYSNVDLVANIDDRTSTSAYVVFLGPNLVSMSSKKQCTVAHSSIEAEYRSVSVIASELQWVSHLLYELSVQSSSTLVIYYDNIGATYLCDNLVFHSRMKHLAMDFHFVHNLDQDGALLVTHVSSYDKLTCALTKPLLGPRYIISMPRSTWL